jgi:acyl carrier protein
MPTPDAVRTLLPTIVHDIAGIPMEHIRHDATFKDDLKIDSLSMVEIMVATEDAFDVTIPDEEFQNLTTIDDVVAYVERASA